MRTSDLFKCSAPGCSLHSTSFRQSLLTDCLAAETSIFFTSFILSLDPSIPSHPITELISAVGARIEDKNIDARLVLNHLPRRSRFALPNLTMLKFITGKKIVVRWNIENRIQHSKLILIDKKILYIGSHNLTRTALLNPYEVTARFFNPELGSQLWERLDSYWQSLIIIPRMDGLTWH